MKKIIVSALAALCIFQSAVYAFEIKEVYPDNSIIENRNIDKDKDINYLESIVNMYSPFYVVERVDYMDISVIDDFYKNLSEPLSLQELDMGKTNFNLNNIFDIKLKNNLNMFKVLGGLSGYTVEFEPVVYFNIYRNISLVGGYSCYRKAFDNPAYACREYIANVEYIAKEILPYQTRLMLEEKIQEFDDFVNADNTFKIFLLVDGKINSVWERDTV